MFCDHENPEGSSTLLMNVRSTYISRYASIEEESGSFSLSGAFWVDKWCPFHHLT